MICKKILIFTGAMIIWFGFNCCNSSPDTKVIHAEQGTINKDTAESGQNNFSGPEIRPYYANGNEDKLMDTTLIKEILLNIPERKLPFYDSTNFDNVLEFDSLPYPVIRFLNLHRIFPYEMKNVESIWIREKINLSDEFILLILGYYPNENELFTTLVSFTMDYELIDFERIAYDEIAEGCFRMESYIDKNKITRYSRDFCYEEKTDIVEYTITENGEITVNQ